MPFDVDDIGALRERITLLDVDPRVRAIASLTRDGTTATVTTAADHGFTTGDRVTIAGATAAAYNGLVAITVTGAKAFTYTVAGAPATPATGTMTAAYVQDALGGRAVVYRDLVTVWAEWRPGKTDETLERGALRATAQGVFRIRTRAGLVPTQRVRWGARTFEVTGEPADADGRREWLLVPVAEVV